MSKRTLAFLFCGAVALLAMGLLSVTISTTHETPSVDYLTRYNAAIAELENQDTFEHE